MNKKGIPIVETPDELLSTPQKMQDKFIDNGLVKQLKLPFEFDVSLLQADIQRIQESDWVAHYNKAHYDGAWTSLALFSKDGTSSAIYATIDNNATLKATEIMDVCLYIREVLDVFKFEKIAVRLMRLNAGAVIKPHRDNALGYEDGEFRLHIPVVTNPEVNFLLGGERVMMNEGTCWYINANEEHSVTNSGVTDRIHLVIDGKRNDWTDGIFFALASESSFRHAEKEMSLKEQELMIEELRRMNTPAALSIIQQLESSVKFNR